MDTRQSPVSPPEARTLTKPMSVPVRVSRWVLSSPARGPAWPCENRAESSAARRLCRARMHASRGRRMTNKANWRRLQSASTTLGNESYDDNDGWGGCGHKAKSARPKAPNKANIACSVLVRACMTTPYGVTTNGDAIRSTKPETCPVRLRSGRALSEVEWVRNKANSATRWMVGMAHPAR